MQDVLKIVTGCALFCAVGVGAFNYFSDENKGQQITALQAKELLNKSCQELKSDVYSKIKLHIKRRNSTWIDIENLSACPEVVKELQDNGFRIGQSIFSITALTVEWQ